MIENIGSPRRGPDIILVLIVTADPIDLESIQSRLAEAYPIQVIGNVTSGRECLRRIDEQQPNVVLIAGDLEDASALDLSRQINLTRRQVATVLLTKDYSVEFYDRASAMGARRVIPMPPMLESLTMAIEEAYFLETSAPIIERVGTTEGQIIVLYSAKGGVGKTFLATNLAALWAILDPVKRVILVDLNLQFGMFPQALQIRPQRTISDLLPVIENLSSGAVDNVLVKKDLNKESTLSVLTGPTDAKQADLFRGKHINALLMALKRQFDTVVIDTTSTLSDVTLAALQIADKVLLVCTPDVPSVSQSRAAIELLHATGVRHDRLRLVLNGVSNLNEVKPADVSRLFDIEMIGVVSEDIRAVQPLTNSGTLLIEGPRGAIVLKDLREVAEKLIPSPRSVVENRGKEQSPKKRKVQRKAAPVKIARK